MALYANWEWSAILSASFFSKEWAKIAKLAFEYIWGPEIGSGVFNHEEYSVTGNPSWMTKEKKKPLEPAKVKLLRMFLDDKIGSATDKSKLWQKEVVNTINIQLWKLDLSNRDKQEPKE